MKSSTNWISIYSRLKTVCPCTIFLFITVCSPGIHNKLQFNNMRCSQRNAVNLCENELTKTSTELIIYDSLSSELLFKREYSKGVSVSWLNNDTIRIISPAPMPSLESKDDYTIYYVVSKRRTYTKKDINVEN